MNKTTKKLFMSSLALAFAAATTISTTYAWFTMQTSATVSQLDVNVTSGTGFQIKFEPQNETKYKQTLSNTDFIEAYGNVLDTLKLGHVTSKDGKNFNTIDVDSGTFDEASSSEYLSFTIDFRGRQPFDIYLKNSSYIWSNGSSFLANSSVLNGSRYGTVAGDKAAYDARNANTPVNINDTKDTNDTLVAFAADAARLSIIDNATIAPKDTKIIDFTKLSDGSYNGGYGSEAEAGNLALQYYNSIVNNPVTYPASNSAYAPATPRSFQDVMAKDDADDVLVSLVNPGSGEYYYAKLTFNVWLEGWDADCFNAIFSDILHIQLSFDGDVDTEKPVLTFAKPTLTINEEITLTATATDNVTPADEIAITFVVTKLAGDTPLGLISLTDNKFTPTAGTYKITATATDAAGNFMSIAYDVEVVAP